MVVKIKPIGFTQKSKAEHLNYHLEVMVFIEQHGAEKLSCTVERPLYAAAIAEEVNVVNLQLASALTPEMEAKDKERDEYLSFLFATVDAAKNSPVAAQREAHKQLAPVVSPYLGIARVPDAQESAQIVGLLNDLAAEALTVHVATLSLDAVISALLAANNEYMLLDVRRTSEMPNKAETNKKRKAVDDLYLTIVDKANATAILTPNAEVLAFVNDINNLIDKTNAAYNRRKAHRGDEPAE